MELRLAIWTVLNLAPEGVALMGPCCASWGLPARATSMRNFINVFGNMALPFVASGNMMISRTLGWLLSAVRVVLLRIKLNQHVKNS